LPTEKLARNSFLKSLVVDIPVDWRNAHNSQTRNEATVAASASGFQSSCVVVSLDSEFTKVPAALFALSTGRRLVTCNDLGQAIRSVVASGAESALLFGSPDVLSQSLLTIVWNACRNHGLRIGLVPSRTRAEADWWVAKRLLGEELYRDYKGLLILARENSSNSFEDQLFTISENRFDESSATKLKDPLQLLLAEFHAKECCAKYNSHVFCGMPRNITSSNWNTSNVAIPQCVLGAKCIWPHHQIRAADLSTCHTIAVSCGSLRLKDRLFHVDVGLGLNIFSGTPRSYISPVRFVVSNSFLSTSLVDFALAGVPLGEIVNEANNLLSATRSDSDCFVLLGDPEDRVNVDFALAGNPSNAPLLHQSSRIIPAIATDDFSDVQVVLVGEDPLSIDSVKIGIPQELNQSKCQVTHVPESQQLLSPLLRQDNRDGLWLPLTYGGHHSVSDLVVSCLWCNGPCVVYDRSCQESLWSRDVVNCPKCGIIADVPDGMYGNCTILGPETIECGSEVEFTARHLWPIYGGNAACAFSLIHCTLFGWPEFEREKPRLSQCIEGEFDVSLRLAVPTETYAFGYWIRSFWITSNGLSWLSKPLTIKK
jgi:hypothetical protein